MNSFLISYDLRKPGRNYDELYKAIKAYGTWCRVLESVWIIRSNSSAKEIRDDLLKQVDTSDALFVGKLTSEAAWYGQSSDVTKWLKEQL